MIKEIKKGDRFRCKKDVIMHPSNLVVYRNGFTYKSDFDGCITGEDGDIYHYWNGTEEDFKHTNEFFELVSTQTPAGLDMPVTCTPTPDDFPRYSREYLDNMVGDIPKIGTDGPSPSKPIDTLPPYYDNSQGSLYQIATQRGWNAYVFDIVKRLDRGGKKDPLRQEIQKSIGVLELWLKELNN
jgi:hypothetical protein